MLWATPRRLPWPELHQENTYVIVMSAAPLLVNIVCSRRFVDYVTMATLPQTLVRSYSSDLQKDDGPHRTQLERIVGNTERLRQHAQQDWRVYFEHWRPNEEYAGRSAAAKSQDSTSDTNVGSSAKRSCERKDCIFCRLGSSPLSSLTKLQVILKEDHQLSAT